MKNDKLLHLTFAATCTFGVAFASACDDPFRPSTEPVPVDQSEDCAASTEWLPDTPPLDLFRPAPHPTTECPFYRGVWQNFLKAMQPIDDQGTPELLTYPTIDTMFLSTEQKGPNRSYLGDIKQAGGRQILVDQNGNSIYYGIQANQAFADFIRENHLQTGKQIQAYPTAQANLFFPAGLVEFKDAWQIVDPSNPPPDLADYIVVNTTVPTLSQDPVTHVIHEDRNKPIPVMARLLAIHVVYTYPGHPEFIWGSMEHSSGTPDTQASDRHRDVAPTFVGQNPTVADPDNAKVKAAVSNRDFVLYKAGTAAKDGNIAVPEYTAGDPHASLTLDPVTQKLTRGDGSPVGTSIYRMFPASKSNETEPDAAISSLNYNAEKVILDANLPAHDRRGHYRLVGAQWMDKPGYFKSNIPIQNNEFSPMLKPNHISQEGKVVSAVPLDVFTASIKAEGSDSEFSILAGEDRMSSTAMESFTQGPTSFNNCFTCHNTQAITAKGVSLDRDRSGIKLLEPGLLNVSHIISQFLVEDCANPDTGIFVDNPDSSKTAVCQ